MSGKIGVNQTLPGGALSISEANSIVRAWVGEGAKVFDGGKGLVSANGEYMYRFPSFKPKLNKTQANLERIVDGKTQANIHIEIKK